MLVFTVGYFHPYCYSQTHSNEEQNREFCWAVKKCEGDGQCSHTPFLLSVWIIGWESMCILQTKEVAAERILFFVVYGYKKEVKALNS